LCKSVDLNKLKKWLSKELNSEIMNVAEGFILVFALLLFLGSFLVGITHFNFPISPMYLFLAGLLFSLIFLVVMVLDSDVSNKGVLLAIILMIWLIFFLIILFGIVKIPIISGSGSFGITPTNSTP